MADSYTKLFSDIVDSSIWNEDAKVCKVWITLLALCNNSDGYVRGSVGWLAGKSHVSVEACQAALVKFSSPDPDSRTPDNDGRRIEALEDGWLILNYMAFRDRLSTNPKTVKTRERVRKHRENYQNKVRPEGYRPTASRYDGYVYYMLEPAADRVKIGYSSNPWARLSELRNGNPTLELIGIERGDIVTEKSRHEQFKGCHLEWEWFRYSDELQRFVAALRSSVACHSDSDSDSDSDSVSVLCTGKGDARGKGFPEVEVPSWEEVQVECQKIGLVEWRARDWFDEMQQCGWKDNKNREVMAWRAYLARVRVWWERDGRPMVPICRANGKSVVSDNILNQSALVRVEDRLKVIRGQFPLSDGNPLRVEFAELKLERERLKKTLGFKA